MLGGVRALQAAWARIVQRVQRLHPALGTPPGTYHGPPPSDGVSPAHETIPFSATEARATSDAPNGSRMALDVANAGAAAEAPAGSLAGF